MRTLGEMGGAERLPLSVRRMVGAAVAVVLCGISVWFVLEACQWKERIDRAELAEPARLKVDLSQAGMVESPFEETCLIPHGSVIRLAVAPAVADPRKLLEGLRGAIEIIGGDGETFVELALRNPDGERLTETGEVVLAYFHPTELGRHTLRLRVDEPAADLAGHDQTIVVRYELCGLERLPTAVLGSIAVVVALPALVIGGLTLAGWWRHGWRAAAGTSTKNHRAIAGEKMPD